MSLHDKYVVASVVSIALAGVGCESVAAKERGEANQARDAAQMVKERAEHDVEQVRREATAKEQEADRKAAKEEAEAQRAENDATTYGAKVKGLVRIANSGGGTDNISVIVARHAASQTAA
jgi:sensor c-di-GMP phosphodiesterase-like protein